MDHYTSPEAVCHIIGSLGNCSPDCEVYLNGECPEPDVMIERLDGKEIENHYEIYEQ